MAKALGILLLIVLLLAMMGQCAGDPPEDPAANNVAFIETPMATTSTEAASPPEAPATEARASGVPLPVPSDPGATYQLIEWHEMPNGHREAITRRDGPSGTSFARREIDCDAMLFRYLGEGDTLEDARRDSPNIGPMAELIPGSISTEVSTFVCSM